MEAGADIRKPGLSRSFQSLIAGLAASLAASLVMTNLFWVWDRFVPSPPVDYDNPPISYLTVWLVLLIPTAAYGLAIGQILHQFGRRLRARKLPFYLVTNLLCAGVIGLALNMSASTTIIDPHDNPALDYGIAFIVFGATGVLWGLIFFAVRRPDRDAPKDMSVSVF